MTEREDIQQAVERDRRDAAERIRSYAADYYNPDQREGFEVAARIAKGWLRPCMALSTAPSESNERVREVIDGLRNTHWLIFNDDREIVGCLCGFKADNEQYRDWGDSVVEHLFRVAMDAA